MADKRELEGIGYHHCDNDDDCLLVEQWQKRPEDLKGQSLPISKMLPPELRSDRQSSREGPAAPFRFRIVVETEKI